MKPIDFTDLERRNKAYAGANGNKISVVYLDEQYMLKFPSHLYNHDTINNGKITQIVRDGNL